jgi:hypothetical protein
MRLAESLAVEAIPCQSWQLIPVLRGLVAVSDYVCVSRMKCRSRSIFVARSTSIRDAEHHVMNVPHIDKSMSENIITFCSECFGEFATFVLGRVLLEVERPPLENERR